MAERKLGQNLFIPTKKIRRPEGLRISACYCKFGWLTDGLAAAAQLRKHAEQTGRHQGKRAWLGSRRYSS